MTDLRHVFWKQLTILGSTTCSPSEFREVMSMVSTGSLTPTIDRVLSLDQTQEAHRLLEAGEVCGKLVIRPEH